MRTSASPKRRGDRGLAIVELSVVVPIMLLLFGGIVEWGMTWRTSNRVTKSVRAAVLEAARHPEDRTADQDLLFRISTEFAPGGLDEVISVIVYRAPASSPEPPPACVAAAEALVTPSDGVTGVCNVYGPGIFATLGTADFTSANCSGSADRWLCPATRERDFGVDDRLGVAVRVRHDWLTGIVPRGPLEMSDQSVAVLAHSLEHP